jgi:Fe-S-cluster-containing hydrogenase component 2
MKRKIIEIDRDRCNGCGLCAEACHEGAIGMVDGKATLLRDDYCDGLGNCLPVCPTAAISFVEREAAAYNEEEVKKGMEKQTAHSGCPGSNARSIQRTPVQMAAESAVHSSELRQWPVQIKLVPVNAPYFDGANLLVAADCAAYARANFHGEFMHGKITLIGCPKLDAVDYSEKLTEIIAQNDIKSLTVVRMEVPCCGGIEQAAVDALKNSGKFIPWQVVTLATDGSVRENEPNHHRRISTPVK